MLRKKRDEKKQKAETQTGVMGLKRRHKQSLGKRRTVCPKEGEINTEGGMPRTRRCAGQRQGPKTGKGRGGAKGYEREGCSKCLSYKKVKRTRG